MNLYNVCVPERRLPVFHCTRFFYSFLAFISSISFLPFFRQEDSLFSSESLSQCPWRILPSMFRHFLTSPRERKMPQHLTLFGVEEGRFNGASEAIGLARRVKNSLW